MWLKEGKPWYVGETHNCSDRIKRHYRQMKRWRRTVSQFTLKVRAAPRNKDERLQQEIRLIKRLNPEVNKLNNVDD